MTLYPNRHPEEKVKSKCKVCDLPLVEQEIDDGFCKKCYDAFLSVYEAAEGPRLAND